MTDITKTYEGLELGSPTSMEKQAGVVEDNVIWLNELPAAAAAALAPLDLDGDGTISVSEIMALRDQERGQKKDKDTFKKMLGGFMAVWFVQIVAVFGC